MEARIPLIALALFGSFGCAWAAVRLAAIFVRRRRAVMMGQQDGGSLAMDLAAWRLRNGYRMLKKPASVLMRIGRVDAFMQDAVDMLRRRGFTTTGEALLSIIFFAVPIGMLAIGAISSSVLAAFVVALCLVVAAIMAVGSSRDKRAEAARDAVPEALESMSACFGSGFTLLQTMQQVAHDVDGPLSEVFGRSAHILETGGGASEALSELRRGDYASELAFVAVALDVQHESGGAMRQVLDAAADTVKGELALRRSLRVQTAQAKLSARVVAIMPFVLVAAFSLISPDYLLPFFQSAFGYALLGAAVAMQAAGIFLVRRALSVDGVA